MRFNTIIGPQEIYEKTTKFMMVRKRFQQDKLTSIKGEGEHNTRIHLKGQHH